VNDSLFLPVRQGAGGVRALAGWECCWLPLGEGEAEGLPAGRSEHWEHVEVPAQLAAVEDRSAVWYRVRFPRPDHGGRILLRFGGAFLAANVWLNGRLLGSHYGYFAPFGFDATPHLKPDNLLVVCCESPVEPEPALKRHVMGWLNDGDSRPYPESAWRSLPPGYAYEVPLGLWRPVELEYVDNVVVERIRIDPQLEADVGRLDVEVGLHNLDGRQMRGEITLDVEPPGGGAPLRLRREYQLGGGIEQALKMTLSIPGARRWLPWRLGEAHLGRVRLEVTVEGRPSARLEERFGFRDVTIRPAPEGWDVRAGGRPFFLRGACYLPAFRLDQLTTDRFASDVELARQANLDALRVHALVLPPEFYAAADAAGVVVLADLPLTRAYAYHAAGDDARFFERAVRAQVPEEIELLRNRPSVALFSGHDDPAWLPSGADLADVHAVRQNYTIDQEAKAMAEALDPARRALAASGEVDEHLWAGWRDEGWAALRDADPRFVTEYGAQALPSLDSSVWSDLGRRWPVADDEPAWLFAGFQAAAWAEQGVGLPSAQGSLEEYVEESQEYQAFVLGYATDQFRLRKLQRCFGAFAYHLVDPVPGIGFGLVDAARHARLALDALTEAMAPVRLIADPTGFVPLAPLGFGWRPGAPVTIRLVIVNDDPAVTGEARVRWAVEREWGPETAGVGRLRDAVRRKSFSGDVACRMPLLAEPALHVTTLSLPIDAEGDYRLDAELLGAGGTLAGAVFEFTVAADLPDHRERPLLPSFLAERLVEAGSLELSASSLRFALRNRTRPAVLTGLRDLRLDGAMLAGARLLVETSSGRVPLPRRLELPLDWPVRVVVEVDPGIHPGNGPPGDVLEVDLTIPGVAGGRVRVSASP
jgi:beta-mannosidase